MSQVTKAVELYQQLTYLSPEQVAENAPTPDTYQQQQLEQQLTVPQFVALMNAQNAALRSSVR